MKASDDVRSGRLHYLAEDKEAWTVLAKHLEIDEADFVQWALELASLEFRDRDLARQGLRRADQQSAGQGAK